MKPAELLFLVPFAAVAVAALADEPEASTKLSARLSREIKASLPRYIAPVASPGEAESGPVETGVLLLPKIEVKEKRVPSDKPDVWLADSVVQQKAMVAYKNSLTDLEWALNSWFIPLFGTPPSARGRAYYEDNKYAARIDSLAHTIKVIEKIDPEAAAKLDRELNHDPDDR